MIPTTRQLQILRLLDATARLAPPMPNTTRWRVMIPPSTTPAMGVSVATLLRMERAGWLAHDPACNTYTLTTDGRACATARTFVRAFAEDIPCH